MKVIAGCATDKGNYHEKNQDRIFCAADKTQEEPFAIACVCDGIGSMKMSEISSQMLVEGLGAWFEGIRKRYPKFINADGLLADLEDTLRELNELVWEYRTQKNIEIGCTMSILLLLGAEYHIFHVGDSRICCVENGIRQLTNDEVVAREREGQLKYLLANFMGKNKALWLNRLSGRLKEEAVFIVGSDGLFKRLSAQDVDGIRKKLTKKTAEAVCREMIETVLSRGERDNVSCALLYLPKKRFILHIV